MEINQEQIENRIVEGAVSEIVDGLNVAEQVRESVRKKVDLLVGAAVEKEIQSKITNLLREGFEHEYVPVNALGRPKGQKTTISAELDRMVSRYWSERVDSRGNVTESSYSSTSRAEWLMMQIVSDKFSAEMKQHVVNLGGSLKDHLRGELRSTLDKLLSEVFHVQSEGDRQLKNPGRSCIDTQTTKQI